MRIGGSLFLIAVGAILTFAISDHVNGVDLGAVGIILMIVGAIGLLTTVVWTTTRQRTEIIEQAGQAGAPPPTCVRATATTSRSDDRLLTRAAGRAVAAAQWQTLVS